MKSQLFREEPKNLQTGCGRWVRIQPDEGEGYTLYDLVEGDTLGRILVDADQHWIYDGRVLSLEEQEEVAGAILGYSRQMDALLDSLQSGV